MLRTSTCVLAAALLAAPAVADDLPQIRQRGAWRVVIDRESLPELFAAGSTERPGFEQEILLGFARRQGVRLEIAAAVDVEERIPTLLAGRADVGAGIVATAARRKLVDFTSEVLPVRHVVVNLAPHPTLATVEALRRVRVGTIRGSSWAEEIARAGVPKDKIDASFETATDLLQALRSGRVEATVLTGGWALAERMRHPELQLGVLLGDSTSLSFAVTKDAPQLRAALDDYLHNLYAAAVWDRLVVRYFGDAGLELLRQSRARR